MNKREQLREIVDSMCDYFDVEYYDDLDSLMKMDLIVEVEECLDINIPLSIFDQELTRKQFIDACLEVYETSINV